MKSKQHAFYFSLASLYTSKLFNKKLHNQKLEVTVTLCALKTFKLDY